MHRKSLYLGTDDKGFGFGGTGKKSYAGKFEDYGESFTLNDIIGCFLDLTSGTIHFSKNGKEFSTAFQIPPKLRKSAFYPSILLKVGDIFHFIRRIYGFRYLLFKN